MPATATTTGRIRPTLADRLAGALAWIAATPPRSIAVLLLVSFLCLLPGQTTIPAVDRDEGRYVQATTQMLETGDYVDIRLHDHPRHYQPAGIYWLQVLAVKLTGSQVPAPIWVHRLPSLIAACLIVLLAYWAAYPLGDRRIAFVAGLMMAALLVLNVEARLAKTDAVLNATILTCQAVLLRLYLSREGTRPPLGWALAFWIAAGLGVLVKGPILVLVVGSTIAAAALLARNVRWLAGLRPLIGLPIALAIALPWYVAIWFATDGAFYAKAIGYSITDKITTGMQSHGAPPGYYFAAFWVTAWPIAAIGASALPSLWRDRRLREVRFLAAWVIPTWIAYELIVTKLPHYVLPLYPAIALAAAAALVGGRIDGERWWVRILLSLSVVGPILLLAGAMSVFWVLEGLPPATIVPLAAAVIGFSLLALRLVRARALLEGWLVLTAVVAPLTYASILGVLAPRLESLWMSPRLAAATIEVAGCANPKVISVGNNEASLIFAIGTDIRFGRAGDAAEFLSATGCRAAIVEQRHEAEFAAGITERGVEPGEVRRVEGVNIANGRRLDFGVYGSAR